MDDLETYICGEKINYTSFDIMELSDLLRGFKVRLDSGFSIRVGEINMFYKRNKSYGEDGQFWTMKGGCPIQITLRDMTIESTLELKGFEQMMSTFVNLYTVKVDTIRYVSST